MIAKQKKQKAFFGFSKNLRSCIINTPRIDSLCHSINLCVQMWIVYDQSIIDNRLFNLKIQDLSISVNIWYYTFFCKIYSNIVQNLMKTNKIHGKIAKTSKSK